MEKHGLETKLIEGEKPTDKTKTQWSKIKISKPYLLALHILSHMHFHLKKWGRPSFLHKVEPYDYFRIYSSARYYS